MSKSIHYLSSRKSDFLAGVDLEIFQFEGKPSKLTIKSVEFKTNFWVNGRKKDKGIVISFVEEYAKPFICNPTNSREIKKQSGIIDASKWVGFTLDFFFNTKVEMKISKTETKKGGISVKKVETNGLVPPLKEISTRIEQSTKKAELLSIWQELGEAEQIEHKDAFTEKYKKAL